MICIVKIGELSPNTERVPTGWIIKDSLDEAIREAEFIGDVEITKQLKRLSPDIGYGRYNLTDDIYVLVS